MMKSASYKTASPTWRCTRISWAFCYTSGSDSASLGWGSRVYISNELPGSTDAAGPRSTLWVLSLSMFLKQEVNHLCWRFQLGAPRWIAVDRCLWRHWGQSGRDLPGWTSEPTPYLTLTLGDPDQGKRVHANWFEWGKYNKVCPLNKGGTSHSRSSPLNGALTLFLSKWAESLPYDLESKGSLLWAVSWGQCLS